jgi:ribosomal protein L15
MITDQHLKPIMTHLTSKQLRHAANIKDKIDSLHSALNKILGYVSDHSPAKAIHRKRRKMSAAAREKISAAAKARWAKFRAKKK